VGGRQTVSIPNERLSTKEAQLNMELKGAQKLLMELQDKSMKELEEKTAEHKREVEKFETKIQDMRRANNAAAAAVREVHQTELGEAQRLAFAWQYWARLGSRARTCRSRRR
jgi:hypothetical protein